MCRVTGNLALTAAILRTPSLRRTNTNRLVQQLCLTGTVVAGTNVPLLLAILLASDAGQVSGLWGRVSGRLEQVSGLLGPVSELLGPVSGLLGQDSGLLGQVSG